MKDKEENTTIQVSRDTHRDLMLFKIYAKAKDLDEVIQIVIQRLKKELGEDNISSLALHSQKEKLE